MSEITIFPIENITDKNYEFTGVKCDNKRKNSVEGCYSSFYYYDTPQQQIASIVVSLVKGHFFIDANKRTALFTYILLSQLNNLKYIEDEEEQVQVFVEIATSHKVLKNMLNYYFKDKHL